MRTPQPLKMTLIERQSLEARLSMLASRIQAKRGTGERLRMERPAKAACSICGKVCTGTELHRDHSHSTGEFRGWLCRDCNLGLGRFKDDTRLLRLAAEYLEGAIIWAATDEKPPCSHRSDAQVP